jgi:hypothetical protein
MAAGAKAWHPLTVPARFKTGAMTVAGNAGMTDGRSLTGSTLAQVMPYNELALMWINTVATQGKILQVSACKVYSWEIRGRSGPKSASKENNRRSEMDWNVR